MNGLQRAIEEPEREQLVRSHRVSNIGSVGITALSGLTFGSFVSAAHLVPAQLIIANLRRDTPALVSGYRSRELQWRRTHPEALEAFVNEWVALEGEQIVAHGIDPLQVVAAARARGIQTPYVFFVESPQEGVVKMGL